MNGVLKKINSSRQSETSFPSFLPRISFFLSLTMASWLRTFALEHGVEITSYAVIEADNKIYITCKTRWTKLFTYGFPLNVKRISTTIHLHYIEYNIIYIGIKLQHKKGNSIYKYGFTYTKGKPIINHLQQKGRLSKLDSGNFLGNPLLESILCNWLIQLNKFSPNLWKNLRQS